MKHFILVFLFTTSFICSEAQNQRTNILLDKDWKFTKGDFPDAIQPTFNDQHWQSVRIPHDWAIYGPFDINNDAQKTMIKQDLETVESLQVGRTGGLPYVGVAWYRRHFDADPNKEVSLLFDGAMSEAHVYINGKEVIFWPYGYNSFHCKVSEYLNTNGKNNVVAVRLENREHSSRWYPGAGLYRNVHLISTNKIHVPIWGTQITTPTIHNNYAAVSLKIKLENVNDGELIRVKTRIVDKNGKIVSFKDNTQKLSHGQAFEQHFIVDRPALWSPETPYLYQAISEISRNTDNANASLIDTYTTRFGIRTVQFVAEKGFYLNGELRKFQGVCNHHDLGPLGAAVNTAALRHQLTLLKDMGADAIRTTHNMPAPDLIALCDEMGFMVIVENFDEWDIAKCPNGYHRYFNEWAEKDMVNMLHQFRNSPSVILWSIGNEVPSQCSPQGYRVAQFLQDICHREDPSRLVTCGMDQVDCILRNGFAALIDVPGLNYRTHRYQDAYQLLPQNMILGAETASTVSSRGVYMLPAQKKSDAKYPNHQSSSYDLEYCPWSNLPEDDFALADDYPWVLGQFVWTGFDYLGEPTPYKSDWPNHSSMFGIIDLASIPKDRFYLYRSIWRKDVETLHILPHWNWKGSEGKVVPIFVYTNYPTAELFINGKSYGKQTKTSNSTNLQERYRLMWTDSKYEAGEVKVVAYDASGKAVAEKKMLTAGKPDRIELKADRTKLNADGQDLAYIRVQVVDKNGNICPHDQRLINFTVSGAGSFLAAANGDPICLDLFHLPMMHAFNGQLTAIVQAGETPGAIQIEAKASGLKAGRITIN